MGGANAVRGELGEGSRSPSANAILVTVAGTAFPPLVALLTAPMLAHGLGATGRGEVAVAQASALLAVSLMGFGFPEAVTHFVARGTRQDVRVRRHVAALTVLFGVVATTAVYGASDWLAGGTPLTTDLIRMASLSIVPGLLLALARARAAGHSQWLRIAVERVSTSLLRLIGVACLLWSGHLTPTAATTVIVFSPLVGLLCYAFKGSSPSGVSSASDVTRLRDVSSYGGRVWVGAISGILLMRIDQTILVPLAGATALGLYAVAVAISEVPLVLNSAIRDVSFTEHSSFFDADRLGRSARISGVATALLAGLLAVIAPWGIPLLFGPDFVGAVGPTLILLIAISVGTPGSIAGAGLSAIGRPGLRSTSLTAAAVVNVIALVLLAPGWGASGAALATLVGNLISSNLNILWLTRHTDSRWAHFYKVEQRDVGVLVKMVGTRIRNGGGRS